MLKQLTKLMTVLLAHDLRPLILLLVCVCLIMVVAYLFKN